MTTMPPSPFVNSGEFQASAPDEAAASTCPQALDAAADIPEPTTSTGGCEEAPASTSTVTVAAGDVGASEDMNHIHELFYYAQKLIEEDRRLNHRFILDENAFLEAIEPPPLFLQRVS